MLYLYIDNQRKSVVQDVFFLKKKKQKYFPSDFQALVDRKPGSHLWGIWDSNLRPNNIYASTLLAARLY